MKRMLLLSGCIAALGACGPETHARDFGTAQQAVVQAPAHSPISITSDSDFTACQCVVSGSGTLSSPYVIGPWAFNGLGAGAVGVSIDGTNLTKSFVLSNLTIAGNGGAGSTGVVLNHINPSGSQQMSASVSGATTSITQLNVGVLVENSNYVTVDGKGENPDGAGVTGQGGTINKENSGGVDVENSSHVTVSGWQFSASGPSISPNWITLDPDITIWSVAGVRFFGTNDSVIDHNAANNTTDVSYTLFNSNHNTVSNNTADYPYMMNLTVADGSSYNLVEGNIFTTGDYIGIMIADPLPGTSTLAQYGASHDNVVTNNQTGGNGPTGKEVAAQTAPAFTSGILVLNGTYNNTITNNAMWGDSGPDITWAQAVPNSSSPIGVDSYKPSVVCNVTASEGGGGVANLNGNVWSGNTGKNVNQSPCIPAQ